MLFLLDLARGAILSKTSSETDRACWRRVNVRRGIISNKINIYGTTAAWSTFCARLQDVIKLGNSSREYVLLHEGSLAA